MAQRLFLMLQERQYASTHTDCEHDGVGQLDVVYVDSWNEANESWDDIRIVHIYRFGDGLESVQQCFCMLEQNRSISVKTPM